MIILLALACSNPEAATPASGSAPTWQGTGECAVLSADIEDGVFGSGWDARGDELLVPLAAGFVVHIAGDGATTMEGARWSHPDAAGPVEARFAGDDEVVVRTARRVLFVHDLETPTLLGSVEVPSLDQVTGFTDPWERIEAGPGIAAIVHSDTSVRLIDRADPTLPRLAGVIPAVAPDPELEQAAMSKGSCLLGDTLVLLIQQGVIGNSPGIVAVWDVSDPDAPEWVEEHLLDDDVKDLSCDDERVLATSFREAVLFGWTGDGRLEERARRWVIEPGLSSSSHPGVIWSDHDGDLAVVNERPFGSGDTVTTIDLAALEAGATWDEARGPASVGDVAHRLAATGGVLRTLRHDGEGLTAGGLMLEDRSLDVVGDQPLEEPLAPWTSSVRTAGHVAYVRVEGETRAFDLSDPTAPAPLHLDDPTPFAQLPVSWPTPAGWLVPADGGVDLVDLSNPVKPRVLDHWPAAQVESVSGTHFVGSEGDHLVWGEVTPLGLQRTPLGCIGPDGELGADADCAFVIDLALVGDRLAAMVLDPTSSESPYALHLYDLPAGAVRVATAEPDATGAICDLDTDGEHLIAVEFVDGTGQVTVLSTDDLTAQASWTVPELYAATSVVDGQLVMAGDALRVWDLPSGTEHPPIDLPLPATGVAFWGDLTVLAAGPAPVVTVDRSCE